MIAVDQCTNVKISAHESIVNYVIILAVVLAYFPQFHRIISRNSSQGISPYFVFLSATFTTSILANILLLHSADGTYSCCEAGAVHSSECFRALSGTAQAGLQWLGSVILLAVYLMFYPRPPPSLPSQPHQPRRHSLSISSLALSPKRRRSLASLPYPYSAKLLAATTALLGLLILVPKLSIKYFPRTTYAPASLVQDWSFFTAALSLLAATVQYLPQLHTTTRLKQNAALSVVMLAIQSPVFLTLGILKATQTEKVPHDQGRRTWTRWGQNGELVWISYMVAGAVEAILLGVCLYLSYTRPRAGGLDGDEALEVEDGEEEYITGTNIGLDTEETPLLPGRGESELRGAGT